ncbi:MAG: methionine--tRNA ligase [Bacteroidia bacterium]|jgi:methionyl-tRNA synthetase|nr:methionine--tRNA ligase [Bacteroidia bacterium]
MSQPKRYTVTAALIYANGPIHIGHLAGCYLPSDIYVRYLRLKGEDVLFVSGTDEHGVPIMIRGFMEKKSPQEVVDHYYEVIDKSFKDFGIEFDIYSRTSKPVHHQFSSEFFTTLYNKGYFTEKLTEQNYDETAKMFLVDRFIVGTCPHCANPKAYGDQCEKCGSDLSPDELINPHSALSGTPPVKKETTNWFLPLDQMQPQLETYIGKHTEWKTNVGGQCRGWLKQGLHPRAMTRDLNWGVPVPLPNAQGKVMYVWFDAPIGYITASKEWFEQPETRKTLSYGGRPLGNSWEPYWKDADTKLVHFIGKDNIVFHCLIFPAMLMAHEGYVLPDSVPANEFLNLEGDKISTSRNWAIWLHEYLDEMPGKQDELRYVLTATSPETSDSDFTWADYEARVNNELTAVFSNFVHRTMVLTHKNYAGKVPAAEKYTREDLLLLEEIARFPSRIGAAIENYRFREAQQEVMALARLGNKYLSDNEPWKNPDPERVKTILNVSLQVCASLSILCQPFLPFTSEKLRRMLNIGAMNWNNALSTNLLAAGHQLNEPVMLFAKVDPALLKNQLAKLDVIRKELEEKRKAEDAAQQAREKGSTAAPAAAIKDIEPAKAETTFDAFSQMDIRIGTITAAERVPKSDKLLKLTVDTGLDTRTVLSGIAKFFAPENIIGQQVTILVNLAPRKMMGVESQGMILMAENSAGELSFVVPGTGNVNNGSTVR